MHALLPIYRLAFHNLIPGRIGQPKRLKAGFASGIRMGGELKLIIIIGNLGNQSIVTSFLWL